MPAENFFDSNILVYLFEQTDVDKYLSARALINENLANRTGCISYQVVQETLNVIGRRRFREGGPISGRNTYPPLANQPNHPNAGTLPQRPPDTSPLRVQLLRSLIVAAALEAGCSTLYSEDMQDGQQIEGLTIRNPFAETRTT